MAAAGVFELCGLIYNILQKKEEDCNAGYFPWLL
jgi:hypothetical protein